MTLGRGGRGRDHQLPTETKGSLLCSSPSLLGEGTPMDPAPSGEGPLLPVGMVATGAASQPTGPAQPSPGELQGGGRRTPVSPDPFRLPGLLPMASPVTGPQRKETGQIHPFPPLHPSLRATLQEISIASAHSAWSRGRGVLSEDPSFSLSMCMFLGRTHM